MRCLDEAHDRLIGHQMPLTVFDPSELRSRAAQMNVEPGFTVLTTRWDADRPPTSGEDLLQVRDWTLTRSDGTKLIATVAVYAARDTDGHLVGFVGIAHDVTEQHRLTRVLAEALVAGEQAAERLLELDRAKTSLVATMSHEIRTPLSNIMGYTELLQEGLVGEISADQRSVLDKVDRNCERLIALADDLGAIAETDAGTIELDLAAVDMCAVVSAACDSMRTVLLDRTLETVLEVPGQPLIVRGDAVQLTRAVLNLLNNAVKFTDDDGTVRCRLTQCDGDAVLEISDNGVGIPRAEQHDLFNRFFRSSTSHERETQGSGLGLSIVASIVDQHGGRIIVVSDHMKGSAFTVRIPLQAPATCDAA
jgi:signal transduction histidine kinase